MIDTHGVVEDSCSTAGSVVELKRGVLTHRSSWKCRDFSRLIDAGVRSWVRDFESTLASFKETKMLTYLSASTTSYWALATSKKTVSTAKLFEYRYEY